MTARRCVHPGAWGLSVRRHAHALLIALAGATIVSWAATASAPAQPTGTEARLEGTFQMSGHVTVARFVRGEHAGEAVQRTWTFVALCASGPCAQVRLNRNRASGVDTLILTQTTPGHYAGTGTFFAPLKCSGRVYGSGEQVPFQITVRVTGTTTAPDGTTVATQITAKYVNKSRLNLTPCVFVLGHDAARYTGAVAAG